MNLLLQGLAFIMENFWYLCMMQIYKGTYKYMLSSTLHNSNGCKLMKIYLGQTLKPTKTLLK